MAEQSDSPTFVLPHVVNTTSFQVSSAAQNISITVDVDHYEEQKRVHVTVDRFKAQDRSQVPYQSQLQGSQIRVFQLDEMIECEDLIRVVFCRQKIVDLDTSPAFKAISYTCTWPYLQAVWDVGDEPEKSSKLVELVECDYPDITNTIFVCDGHPIFVHLQCYGAVQAFRGAAMSGWVWIDALCIRQNDDEEKAFQVRLMRRIFASASEVLVFLGPDQDLVYGDMDEVMDLIRCFVTALSEAVVDNRLNKHTIHPGCLERSAFQKEVGIADLYRKFIAFAEFCGTCRWFGRVWCIQEIVLSRRSRMRIGEYEFDWEILANIIVIMQHQGWIRSLQSNIKRLVASEQDLHWFEGLERMVDLQRETMTLFARWVVTDQGQTLQFHEPQGPFDIAFDFLSGGFLSAPPELELDPEPRCAKPTTISQRNLIAAARILADAGRATCYDDRDRIYGALGLLDVHLPDDISSYIDVDYSKSVEDVIKEAVSLFLERSQSLDVLGARFPKLTSTATQSSWMPYLRAYDGLGSLVPFPSIDPTDRPYNASEGLLSLQYQGAETGPPFEIEYPRLKLFGGDFDRIKHVLHTDMLTFTSKTMVELADILPKRLRGRRRFECIWRTLVRDCYERTYPAPQLAELAFHQFLVKDYIHYMFKQPSEISDASAEQLSFLDHLLSKFELDDSTSAARQSWLFRMVHDKI